MNVFLQELRSHKLNTIVWSLSMVGFMYMCMVKFDTLAKTGTDTLKLLNQFPDTMMAVFGMSGLDITTLGGYFGICYLFMLILIAVHAGLLGVHIIAREAQSKTTEFIYTKPSTRNRIMTAKILSGLVQLLIIWAATYIGSWLSIISFTSINGFTDELAIFMVALAVVQLVFFATGVLFASFARSPSAPAKWMSGVIFAAYILYILAQFKYYSWVHIVSIFSYFNAVDILKSTSIPIDYTIICLCVATISILLAYYLYNKRDLIS